MSQVTSEMIKRLREMTGAGMMDCKTALNEAEGSMDKAIEILRKKGLKDIAKRAGKTAAEAVHDRHAVGGGLAGRQWSSGRDGVW